MEEGQAITLLKQGDIAGLEVLVLRYQVMAVQTAYLIVGDRHMAEDIAQAAFLKAAERIHQFEDGRPFRPWILRIVTNDAIKACSRAKRHLSLDAPQELDALPTWLRDPNPGPEELADTAENRRMVWEALQQLTTKQRAVVVMRYFLDMKDSLIQMLDQLYTHKLHIEPALPLRRGWPETCASLEGSGSSRRRSFMGKEEKAYSMREISSGRMHGLDKDEVER